MLQRPNAIATNAAAVPPLGEPTVPRYAIYYAPHPASAWWSFGSAWLGRDAVSGAALAPPRLAGWDPASVAGITEEPRRYGFHATLKAPFRLARGYAPFDVYLQAATLAASLDPQPLPPLELTEIDGFVALAFAPQAPGCDAVNAIAAHCVSCFDNLRASATAAEIARRHEARLTERQASLLAQWGYPHVFDEYRFHLTLSGRLSAAGRAKLIGTLQPLVAALRSQPLSFDALTVYWQPRPEVPMLATRRFGFDGSVDIYRDE